MKLPPRLIYPFIKLGAQLYGGFDLEETSPETALINCKIPVIFFHGEADDFVPCDMSRENYAACAGPKALITIPGAGHGAGVDNVNVAHILKWCNDIPLFLKRLGNSLGLVARNLTAESV